MMSLSSRQWKSGFQNPSSLDRQSKLTCGKRATEFSLSLRWVLGWDVLCYHAPQLGSLETPCLYQLKLVFSVFTGVVFSIWMNRELFINPPSLAGNYTHSSFDPWNLSMIQTMANDLIASDCLTLFCYFSVGCRDWKCCHNWGICGPSFRLGELQIITESDNNFDDWFF